MQTDDHGRVRYQSISPRAKYFSFSACLVLFALLILSLNPQIIVHLHPKIFAALVLAATAAAAVTVCVLWMGSKIESAIKFDDQCLKFPPNLAPDLLFRLYRPWGDISAVGLEDLSNDNEFASCSQLNKRILFFYFKSGGHVNLSCANFSLDDLEKMLDAIICNAPGKTCSPEIFEWHRNLVAQELPPANGEDEKSGPPRFTQMWEYELEAHMNATNFVPLEPGHKLGGKFKFAAALPVVACQPSTSVTDGMAERL